MAERLAEFQTTFAVSKPDRIAELWLETRAKRQRGFSPRNITVSPLVFSSSGTRDKSLELELMHRWSTRSWTLLYAVPEWAATILTDFTRDSLGYACMTRQILAIAALETALNGGGAKSGEDFYLRLSVEYTKEATAQRRQQMKRATKDNVWLLFQSLALQAVLQFSLPSMNDDTSNSVIDRCIGFWEGTGSSIALMYTNWQWLCQSKRSATIIQEKYPVDSTLMDTVPAIKVATQVLSDLLRLARLPPTGNPELDGEDGLGPYASAVKSYRFAADQTRYAFAEDRIKAYLMTVCIVAHTDAHGPEFMQGLRDREPIALFILMFWGVLLNATSLDGMIWYVRSEGRDLVEETSEIIAASYLVYLEDVQEGMRWCRQ